LNFNIRAAVTLDDVSPPPAFAGGKALPAKLNFQKSDAAVNCRRQSSVPKTAAASREVPGETRPGKKNYLNIRVHHGRVMLSPLAAPCPPDGLVRLDAGGDHVEGVPYAGPR